MDCLIEGTLITIFAGLVLRTARLRNSAQGLPSGFLRCWHRDFAFVWRVFVVAVKEFLRDPLSHVRDHAPGFWALYLFGRVGSDSSWIQLAGVGRSLWHLHVLHRSLPPSIRRY